MCRRAYQLYKEIQLSSKLILDSINDCIWWLLSNAIISRSEFEKKKKKFKSSSPTTEQIKNSINLITNQDKGGQRKISSPVGRKQQQAQLIGKQPCARDGHSVIIAGECMIVFGGDRNLMSFNDLYMYQFSMVNKPTK
ncbi:unnamed protein product [Paramecium sonneborni]|uniref:Uncharacterized protein n=1 Tax=Paramecium sonneborni TaxID=65129 RepID=A0A8S1L1E0_9CILI|nr:unnamed protein product [Paramecium sonneborni]